MKNALPLGFLLALSCSLLLPFNAGADPVTASSSLKKAPLAPKTQAVKTAPRKMNLPRLSGDTILAGFAAETVTPTKFEVFDDDADRGYTLGEPFYDTGVDRLFDYEETGAFGPDGKPGIAAVDDDRDGVIDNCERGDCREYRSPYSDDLKDPAGDDYNAQTNPTGTEGNGVFEYIHLGGFGPQFWVIANRAARGVHDHIWARSVYVEKNGVPFVLCVTDFPGLQSKEMNPVKRRIEADLGIPFENIVISSTHCHQAPDPTGMWDIIMGGPGRPADANWVPYVMDQMYESIKTAYLSAVPCYMRASHIFHDSCFDPVTHQIKREPNCNTADFLDAQDDPNLHYDTFLLQTDMRDPVVRNTMVSVLKFDAVSDGHTMGTLVNWHNHPEMLEGEFNLISSDFVHYVRDRMEAKLGGTCVYASGTFGNQIGGLRGTRTPLYTEDGNIVWDPGITQPNGKPFPQLVRDSSFEKIRGQGYSIADAAIEALGNSPDYVQDARVSVLSEDLDIDIENFLYDVVLGGAVFTDGTYDDRDKPIKLPYCNQRWGCLRTPITVATVGDMTFLTAPGEVDPSYLYGRQASTALYDTYHPHTPPWGDYYFPPQPALLDYVTTPHVFFVGSGNSYLSYLVHETDFLPLDLEGEITGESHPNYYEDLVSLGFHFGDNVGNKLMQMLGSPARFSTYPIRP